MKILLEAGSPMYLGFLIHVCLHFLIIQVSIGKRVPDGDPSSSNSSYRSTRSSTISEYSDAEG